MTAGAKRQHTQHVTHPCNQQSLRAPHRSVAPVKNHIKSRVGSGTKWFDYITGNQIITNMNKIFGFSGWSDSYSNIELKQVFSPDSDPNGKNHYCMSCIVVCTITLKDGTARQDIGEGDGIMGDLHACVAKAQKQVRLDEAGAKRQQKHYTAFLHNEQSSTRCRRSPTPSRGRRGNLETSSAIIFMITKVEGRGMPRRATRR